VSVTPAQTVGPFFAIELPYGDGPFVVPERTEGAVWLHGRLLDGAGEPIPDGMIESWQADPPGPAFRGFGRCGTDEEGRWTILTLKPGPVSGAAPHVDLAVFARGLLNHVVTRLYFGDEAEANAADPVLSGLDEAARATLVATPTIDGYELDIHMQGPHETTFFAV
jgi:protocatechuate 3,4-dioxygenase, alpha subunit